TVIASVPAGGASDAAGNTNTVSTSTDHTVTYDTQTPTVTSINQIGRAYPTNASPIDVTATSTKPVTGSTGADVDIPGTTGQTTAVVTEVAPHDGTTYTVAVSWTPSNGTVIASVPAGGASDAAGNTNTVSTSTDHTVTYDTQPPTVTSIN